MIIRGIESKRTEIVKDGKTIVKDNYILYLERSPKPQEEVYGTVFLVLPIKKENFPLSPKEALNKKCSVSVGDYNGNKYVIEIEF